MSNHVKNQHYVPQFLLKKFSSREEKFIWAYDKENPYSVIRERPIKKVANEFFFYDQVENCKEGSFEYVLQMVENDAAPVIHKILKEKNLRKLTVTDREKIALFITSQLFRTKGHYFETERISRVIDEQIKEAISNPVSTNINAKDLWFSTLEEIPRFKDVLLGKIWSLIESNGEFYISDNPVVRQNTTNRNELRGTLGLDSYGIEIYLPLSPSTVIALFCEKFFNEKGYQDIYIDNLKAQPENIENLNWLQTVYASKFIFSSSPDFSLVIRNNLNKQ